MKIKTVEMPYNKVMALPRPQHKNPKRPSVIFRMLVRALSQLDLWKAHFKFEGKIDKKGGPYLVLMNHSSFIDVKIAHGILYPMPFHIVSTHDAFVGKHWLMKKIGCLPTKKFVSDAVLISDMKHALKKGTSVLMYPEAGYTFDGTPTTLPERFGRLIKLLNVPVVFIETKGAFTRDPLYNGLKIRRVPVSATVSTLFTKQQIAELSTEQIDDVIKMAFSFDGFAWQRENKIKVDEEFRAEGLERILYRCAACNTEGKMATEGSKLVCRHCGKSYTLSEYGELVADDGKTEFSHMPDWYNWERQCVRSELLAGKYEMDIPVDVGVMVDYKALYKVGSGRLVHNLDGFTLTGCDGQLEFTQTAKASYGLNADYFWYELGDVICVGNTDVLYYCFTPEGVSVTKARLAAEELFKIVKEKQKAEKHAKCAVNGMPQNA